MSELQRLRTKIDGLDRRIVALLNQRLATVGKIGEWKAMRKLASYSPARSAEIQRNVQRANQGPHEPEQLAAIYRKIIAASVALQKRQKKKAKASRHKAAPAANLQRRRKETGGGAFLSAIASATAERPDSAKASRRKAAPTADPISKTSRKK
ncbi:MAG: chorismate mutase [Opitutae bacterium]|nr:chorismate mutase [Opitutae bacterium]